MAIGAAGSGFRPIADWRQVTFCFVAMDQIVNQAAKIHYMFGGQVQFPILFRAAVATEDAASFAALKAPVKRVCALAVPIPYSPILEKAVFPDRDRIIAGVREVLQ